MKVVPVVIVSCLMGIAVEAQIPFDRQLAEFAREERMRRESQGEVSEGVVSTDNIRRAGFPVVIGRVGTVVPGGASSGPADAVDDAPDEVAGPPGTDDPLEALRRQQRLVQELEDEEVRLQLDINRYRARFQAPVVSQRERDEASQAMSRLSGDLDLLRVELAQAVEELAALEEAAAAAAPVQ